MSDAQGTFIEKYQIKGIDSGRDFSVAIVQYGIEYVGINYVGFIGNRVAHPSKDLDTVRNKLLEWAQDLKYELTLIR